MQEFAYFQEQDSEQFTFYKIPKVLFTDPRFGGISTEAKLLYGVLLDRVSLSRKNGWIDENGNVYIQFTVAEMMEYFHWSRYRIYEILHELGTEDKGIGLVERKRIGCNKPNTIYVKNFASILERNRGAPDIRQTEDRISNNNQTEESETESNHIISISAGRSDRRYDAEAELNAYAELIKENIDYDILLKAHPLEKDTIEGIYQLILETALSSGEKILIASNWYPAALVKSKFMKLNFMHIEYILDQLSKNTTKVRNIKKYILAALFNAPATIDSYYRAEVNHDFPQYAAGK